MTRTKHIQRKNPGGKAPRTQIGTANRELPKKLKAVADEEKKKDDEGFETAVTTAGCRPPVLPVDAHGVRCGYVADNMTKIQEVATTRKEKKRQKLDRKMEAEQLRNDFALKDDGERRPYVERFVAAKKRYVRFYILFSTHTLNYAWDPYLHLYLHLHI
jgi:hypothetical protein